MKALLILILAGGLWACAAPNAELQRSAERSLARAYASGAAEFAPESYRASRQALDAATAAERGGDREAARQAYRQAELLAKQAIWQSRQVQARQAEAGVMPPASDTSDTATEATALEPAEQPAAEPAAVVTEPPPAKPRPLAATEPPITAYVVKEGETLWSIAARRDIYADALLWPLIYKANRDQIKDPRQIYPSQVLSIPRNVSDAEREESREKARKSEIIPVDILLKLSSPKAQ